MFSKLWVWWDEVWCVGVGGVIYVDDMNVFEVGYGEVFEDFIVEIFSVVLES